MKTRDEHPVTRIGLGTYLGHLNDETDERLVLTTRALLGMGVNHLDTAPNYRGERAEAALGMALKEASQSRESLFIGTKVGYLPFRRQVPKDPSGWIQRHYVEPGLIQPEDILRGVQCFAPDWIERQLSESLGRLGSGYVDVLYLHNLESAFAGMPMPAREQLVRKAFQRLRELHARGQLRAIGVASWGGFIGEGPEHIALENLCDWAQKEDCAELFRYIQAPFSVSMPQALFRPTQHLRGRDMSLARAVADCGMELISSAPLLHGKLAEIDIPSSWQEAFPNLSAAQACLAMAVSAPGIASTLIGLKSEEHLVQFQQVFLSPALEPSKFLELVRG